MRATPCSSTIMIARALLLFGLLPLLAACAGAVDEVSPSPPDATLPARTVAPVIETPAQKAERLQWWTDARFGLFIHWGLYAVPAGEWKGTTNHGEWFMDSTGIPIAEYEQFAKQFDPQYYDPDAWMRAAKAAGMKYVIVTSKHHDGFAMWDTAATDYNIVKRTPYAKDALKPLAAAARRQGLHFGTYYSIMDWRHPSQRSPGRKNYNPTTIDPLQKAAYVREMKAELKELVNELATEVLWFDGEWVDWWTCEDALDMMDFLKQLKPDILINNRVLNTRGGMAGISPVDAPGDFGTPEQEVPASGLGPAAYWESCMTMNTFWGYNQFDDRWKSGETLVRNLIDTASKGGNYLLNIGPTAQGELPASSLERLAQIGRWMQVNGEAIHGSRASPFQQAPAWGRVTRKPGKLYLHVFDWPQDGELSLPSQNKVAKAYLLAASTQPLRVTVDAQGTRLQLPKAAPDPVASVIVLELAAPSPSLGSMH